MGRVVYPQEYTNYTQGYPQILWVTLEFFYFKKDIKELIYMRLVIM
jgi:hypothetical protein